MPGKPLQSSVWGTCGYIFKLSPARVSQACTELGGELDALMVDRFTVCSAEGWGAGWPPSFLPQQWWYLHIRTKQAILLHCSRNASPVAPQWLQLSWAVYECVSPESAESYKCHALNDMPSWLGGIHSSEWTEDRITAFLPRPFLPENQHEAVNAYWGVVGRSLGSLLSWLL